MEQANLFRSEEAVRAILVSVITPDMDPREAAVSLDELEKLLETAGGTLFAQLIQQRQTPVAATYLGTGKLEELKELCQANDIHLVVFDCELSPAQIKNIENALEDEKGDFEVRVIDRSMLILDISPFTQLRVRVNSRLSWHSFAIPVLDSSVAAPSCLVWAAVSVHEAPEKVSWKPTAVTCKDALRRWKLRSPKWNPIV